MAFNNVQETPSNQTASPWMTAPQAATYIGVALGTIRNWTSARFIPFSRRNRVVRYHCDTIDRWLAKGACAGRSRALRVRLTLANRKGDTMNNPPEQRESDHDLIQEIPIADLHPAPENDKVYRPIDLAAPDFCELVESVRVDGIHEPLIVSRDRFVASGNRRLAAAIAAGLTTVPCVVREDVSHAENPDKFMQLLRECNRQRVKSFDEKLREEVVTANADEAYKSLCRHREEQAELRKAAKSKIIDLGGYRGRSQISAAKQPFLAAIKAVIEDLRDFWPLSDRQIHYGLLNNPPLIHASKPGSIYGNNLRSYKSLVELLTRARLAYEIDFDVIADETRPVNIANTHYDVQSFINAELDVMFMDYHRNLQQSQPNHIELLVEKNTVRSIIEPIAEEFCIPLTSGRGYCSLPPRHAMSERFSNSGKEKLIILVLSDFDPDGEEIASSFTRSLRDDFDIQKIAGIKVGLTGEQVRRFKLPPSMIAKAGCSTRAAFVAKHGEHVFELEALPPAQLQQITREAIRGVLDTAAFNRERTQEMEDARELAARRRLVLRELGK